MWRAGYLQTLQLRPRLHTCGHLIDWLMFCLLHWKIYHLRNYHSNSLLNMSWCIVPIDRSLSTSCILSHAGNLFIWLPTSCGGQLGEQGGNADMDRRFGERYLFWYLPRDLCPHPSRNNHAYRCWHSKSANKGRHDNDGASCIFWKNTKFATSQAMEG